MNGEDFFRRVAYPLYRRHQNEGESEELLWAAITSLNHVADYSGQRVVDSNVELVRSIANALKHGKRAKRRSATSVDPQSLSNDFFSIPDVFAEPNIFAIWVIEIDGETCSIGPVLKSAVEFWSNKLDTARTTT